jgi:hypothetical protein
MLRLIVVKLTQKVIGYAILNGGQHALAEIARVRVHGIR